MNTRLFRQEAIDHQREPVRGSLLIASSPRSTLLAIFAFAIAASLLSYAWLGEYSRKAHVQGFLAPNKGLVKVYPQVSGTLLERRVEEGQRVRQGDVLAVISTERGSLSVRAANDATIELLRERLASLEKELEGQRSLQHVRERRVERQLTSLLQEREQLQLAVATHTERLRSAEREVERLDKLQVDGFVAVAQVQQERDRVLEQRGRLQILERDRVALQGRIDDLGAERKSVRLEAEAMHATLQRRIAELVQERTEHESNSDVVIAAPTSGIVSTVLLQPGQRAGHETPLLSIIPDGAELEARLLVPSHAIGFIAPQQSVALRYGAFPYQRFGHYQGQVRSIAKSLLLPGETDLPMMLQEPAYLVTVALAAQHVRAYGKTFALQAGMALDADIMLDRRSIIEWIFDPLFSLVART